MKCACEVVSGYNGPAGDMVLKPCGLHAAWHEKGLMQATPEDVEYVITAVGWFKGSDDLAAQNKIDQLKPLIELFDLTDVRVNAVPQRHDRGWAKGILEAGEV